MVATRPKKSLGQNFLVDHNAIDRIIGAAPRQPNAVVEIGPGRGALLQPLLERYAQVTAVEMDDTLAAEWRTSGHPGLQVIHADAVQPAWLEALAPGEHGVVANLPYNAATPILRLLLQYHSRFPWLVLMFQREVADRILFAGGRDGGPLGVLAQWVYRVEHVLTLGPEAFSPPPKVYSKVVKFVRLPAPLEEARVARGWPLLLRLFQRRRARLDSAIASLVKKPRDLVQAWFLELGIRSDARPDHVSPSQYLQLIDRIEAIL